MNLEPTNKLRFVLRERVVEEHKDGSKTTVKDQRVLQQWWSTTPKVNIGWGELAIGKEVGEWRDVPLEMEEPLAQPKEQS